MNRAKRRQYEREKAKADLIARGAIGDYIKGLQGPMDEENRWRLYDLHKRRWMAFCDAYGPKLRLVQLNRNLFANVKPTEALINKIKHVEE